MLRVVRRLALFGLRLLLLLVLFGSMAVLGFNKSVRRGEVPVPDLGGLALADAELLLRDQGLEMRWDENEDRFDDTVPAGHVLEHDPGPAGLVKRGSGVRVVLSRGQQLVQVPELEGRAIQAAQVTLGAAGLALGSRGDVRTVRGPAGDVIWQYPRPGDLVDRSTPIGVLVSSDETDAVYVMPDLVYRQNDVVRNFFQRHGFRMGSVKYEPYEGVPEGIVLRQYPLAGHALRRQIPISLVVSASPSEDT